MFVAVGDSGTIMTSVDGLEWEQQFSGSNEYLTSVVWGDGQFIAVGHWNTVLASLNDRQWSSRETWIQKPNGGDPNYSSLAFGNGTYVAAGDMTIYSQNGIDWEIFEH
ncbi:MAG: hypothetical protein ACOC41_08480 [Chitinivibrionales bacterium]